jgi:UDP-glucose 4-epimerase
VYGDGYRTPAAESAPLDPRSAYAQSKVEAEAILAAATGVESVLLRCFNVFGERFDESLVARLQHSSPDAPVTLYGTDDFVRDYIHVAEVMRGLVAAFRVPLPAPSRVFNIGSGRPLSNRELVERLQRRSPVHYVVRSGARSYSCADPSRARAELGLAAGRSPG